MLTPILCLAAQGVIRDAETNNVSVFAILEQLNPAGFPLFVSDLGMLAIWTRAEGDPDQFDVEIVIRNNANELTRGPFHIDFAGMAGFRSIVRLQGLVITEPGVLRFSVFLNGDEIAHYQARVTAPAPAVQPAGGSQSSL